MLNMINTIQYCHLSAMKQGLLGMLNMINTILKSSSLVKQLLFAKYDKYYTGIEDPALRR